MDGEDAGRVVLCLLQQHRAAPETDKCVSVFNVHTHTHQVTHLSVLHSPASLGLIQLLLVTVFITEVDRKQDVGQVSVTDPSSSALHSDVHHDAADFRDWN